MMETKTRYSETPESFLDQLRVLVVNLPDAVLGAPTISYSDVQELRTQLEKNIIYSQFAAYKIPSEQATSFLRDSFAFQQVALESDPERLRHRSVHFQLRNVLSDSLDSARLLRTGLFRPALIGPALLASRLLLNHDLVVKFSEQSSGREVIKYLDELWANVYFVDAISFALYRLFWELEAMRKEGRLDLEQRRGCMTVLLSRLIPASYEIPVKVLFDYWQEIQEEVERCRNKADDFAEWLRLLFQLKPRLIQFEAMLNLSHPVTDKAKEMHQRLKFDNRESWNDLADLYVQPELTFTVFLSLSLAASRTRGLQEGIRELRGNYRSHICFPKVVLDKLITVLMNEPNNPSDADGISSHSELDADSLQLSRQAEMAIVESLSPLDDGFRKALTVVSKERERVFRPLDEFVERRSKREASSFSEMLIETIDYATAISDTSLLPEIAMGISFEKYKLSAYKTPEGVIVFAESQDLLFSDVLSQYRAYSNAVLEILKSLILAVDEIRDRDRLSKYSVTLRLPCGQEQFQLVLPLEKDGISGALIEPRSVEGAQRKPVVVDDEAIKTNIVVLATLRKSLNDECIPIYPPGSFMYASQIGSPWVKMEFRDQ
jgi:hypothetical protein